MANYPTRVRYGLRLLVRLALQDGAQHLSIGDIAQEEGVSVKYLEQIVSLLKPLGVLASVRGAHGGYSLTRSADQISVEQVLEALGGLNAPAPCFENKALCGRVNVCTTRTFWHDFDMQMRKYLGSVSLADVIAKAPQGDVEFLPDFCTARGCKPKTTKTDRALDQ